MQAITNAIIYTGESVVSGKNILVKNGLVTSIADEVPANAKLIDLKGKNIAPGFIDIQINGGYEYYFSRTPDEKTLTDIYTACRDFATPYFLVTLISSPHHIILEAIEAMREFMKTHPGVLGMHLEGPFINSEKRGAHNKDVIRKPTDEALKEIIEKGKGVIKMMTIAPECLTERQLEMLLASDIIISAGHSNISYTEAQHYFSKGINLVTHLYNAMTQMGHRECGIVGAVFDNENVFAPIILDGGHCHYAAARIACRQKKEKLFLLSDSSFLGRRKTAFDWEGLNIKMTNGFYRDAAGNLAGAAISMPEAVKNAHDNLNISLQEAVEMATSRVAKAIGMSDSLGFIKPGHAAKFVVFDDALEHFQLLEL